MPVALSVIAAHEAIAIKARKHDVKVRSVIIVVA